MLQVTEDTPPDMLAGAMDLTVHLPSGRSIKMAVERSTPMMDLLVQITTNHHLQLSKHTLQPLAMASGSESAAYRDQVLPYKPNTPLGTLDTQHIRVVARPKPGAALGHQIGKHAPQPPGHQPFEATFRLKVYLPRNQLYVIRVGGNVILEDIMKKVCCEKNLDPSKYEFKHPDNLDQVLNPKLPLADYQITEIFLTLKASQNLNNAYSTNHMVLRKDEERKLHKSSSGVFNLIFRRGKSRPARPDSVSSDARSISPAHSEDSRSVTPPVTVQPVANAKQNESNVQKTDTKSERPKPPQRKRRVAPKPPQQNENERSEESSSENKTENGSLTICHSRNSSDSSGYHEASVLSDNFNSFLPRRPKSAVIVGANTFETISKQHSQSSMNLSQNGSKTLPGRKKKAAPPPPQVHGAKTSNLKLEDPSPVVASQANCPEKEIPEDPTSQAVNALKPHNMPVPLPRSKNKPSMIFTNSNMKPIQGHQFNNYMDSDDENKQEGSVIWQKWENIECEDGDSILFGAKCLDSGSSNTVLKIPAFQPTTIENLPSATLQPSLTPRINQSISNLNSESDNFLNSLPKHYRFKDKLTECEAIQPYKSTESNLQNTLLLEKTSKPKEKKEIKFTTNNNNITDVNKEKAEINAKIENIEGKNDSVPNMELFTENAHQTNNMIKNEDNKSTDKTIKVALRNALDQNSKQENANKDKKETYKDLSKNTGKDKLKQQYTYGEEEESFKDPQNNDIEWQYQLPSPPRAFKDLTPEASLSTSRPEPIDISEATTNQSFFQTSELIEKLKIVESSHQSEVSSSVSTLQESEVREEKSLLNTLSLETLEARKSLVYNRELATSLKANNEFKNDLMFKSSDNTSNTKKDPSQINKMSTSNTLPNFKIAVYDQPKTKIKVFEDDTVRSNTESFYFRSKPLAAERGALKDNSQIRLQSLGLVQDVLTSTETTIESRSMCSPSKPISRSKSVVTLNSAVNKFRERSGSTDDNNLSRSNSLYDVTGLQSLEVMKRIQNKLNTPTSSIDNLTKTKKIERKEPKKEYRYTGPPSVNMGTWSERPKLPVSIKNDGDYKIGNKKELSANKTTITINKNNSFPNERKTEGTTVTNRFTEDFRKPFTNLKNQQRIEKNSDPNTKDSVNASRVPVVKAVELKKPSINAVYNNGSTQRVFQENDFRLLFLDNKYKSLETLTNSKDFSKPTSHKYGFEFRAAPTVRGFSNDPSKDKRLSWKGFGGYSTTLPSAKSAEKEDPFGKFSNLNFAQSNLKRKNSIEETNDRNVSFNGLKKINGDIIKPPPLPTDQVVPFRANLKKIPSKNLIVDSNKNSDKRGQLLAEIRNFGGRKGLKIKTVL